jgi:hypothetical protein
MQQLNLPSYDFSIRTEGQKQYIFDDVRKKYVVNTPEEWVRQNFIRFLVSDRGFPRPLISIEHEISLNRLSKRCDAVVFSKSSEPLMILEFKAPDIPVSQNAFDQIVRYNLVLKVSYLLITNGMKHFCCKVNIQNKNYIYLSEIPNYEELTD